MGKLHWQKEQLVVRCLVNGNSIRGTERIAKVHRDTVTKIMVRRGEECQNYLRLKTWKLPHDHWQVDEIWNYVAKKEDHLTHVERLKGGKGDRWLFVACGEETKLVPVVHLGKRTNWHTRCFLEQLQMRLPDGYRPKISSDAMKSYEDAVYDVFGDQIDYGQIVKNYSKIRPRRGKNKKPPNPNKPFITRKILFGNFDLDSICTSHVERANGTIRNDGRRFTRRTLAFSKKLHNLDMAIWLQIANYNFCRIHRTLKTTPAVAAGIASEPMSVERLIENAEGFFIRP
jgi:IS1 family transposase